MLNTQTAGPLPYRWVILGVLWVTYLVVFLSRLSVGPLAPFFKTDLAISNAQVGLVMSTAALGYALTQIPTGWIVDHFGARWPIAIGELLAAGCMLAVSQAVTYSWLLVFMLLTGMSCGLLMPATTQAVVAWFPRRERATVMGVKQTAVNMGGILGAATLPILATHFGWRAGFLAIAGVAFAIGWISLLLYRDPAASGKRSAMAKAAATEDDGRDRPFIRLLKSRNVWLVAIAGLCMNWVEMAMLGHFVLYMKEALGYSVVAAGAMLASAETAGAIARPGSGVVSDRLFQGGRRPVFLILAITATVLAGVITVAGPHLGALIYPVVFLFGIGAVGFGAIFFTMLSELGGRANAASAAALGSTVSMIGSIIGPPVFGRIVDVTGSYVIAWASLTVMGGCAVITLLLVREDPHAEDLW